MIVFEAISHAYGEVRTLDNVCLRLPEAQVTALIGPSGCGKSTLLKLAAGLLWPASGSISIDGRALTRDNVLEWRRRVGYVIQSGGLFPHLTARENVALMARHLRRPPDWIDARIASLASLTRLDDALLQRYPSQLSGGQRQRVSLMRALMLDPGVLLLDEPLGALDPMVRYELQQELQALFHELRKSVLLVTHDLAEAAFFSRHIVLMQAGRIVQQGPYESLLANPASRFVQDFLHAQRALTAAADVHA